MTKLNKILSGALGAMAVLGGAAALYVTKTRSGFGQFLDWLYNVEFPDIPTVRPSELAAELNGQHPPVLIDARSPEEYAVSRLRNAQLVSASAFTLDDVDDIDHDRSVVVYDSVGMRSGRIVRRMMEAGFTNVRVLYGGIFLWYNELRPVYRSEVAVNEIHPHEWLWGQFITREGKTAE